MEKQALQIPVLHYLLTPNPSEWNRILSNLGYEHRSSGPQFNCDWLNGASDHLATQSNPCWTSHLN